MSLFGERFNINYVIARSFYNMASRVLDIKFKVEGEEHLTNSGPAILVGNHQTMLDILYLGRIFPKRASILAKRELKWMPFLGQYMLLSGAVFVNRSNAKDAQKSLAEAGDAMKKQNTSLWIIPEGTRSSQETSNLLPFKKGAFHLAVQSGLPIIPVVCENYWRLYRKGALESGTLRIQVLPPIPTEGSTVADVGDLANRTRDQMLKVLMEISQPNLSENQQQEGQQVESSGSGNTEARKDPVAETKPAAEPVRNMEEGTPAVPEGADKRNVRGLEGSETSSVSGEHTEEEEGMVLVGRPPKSQ